MLGFIERVRAGTIGAALLVLPEDKEAHSSRFKSASKKF
jgi:hypothetical protein